MEGWIKIQRKIVKHWIWSNAKYLQGWVYILYRANYEDTKVLVGATLMPLKRGTFITSLDKFAKATHMSIQETRTFLSLLESDEMINKETTSKLTQITVCNYELYQDTQHTDNIPTTNQQQTSNNREEVKEVKEEKEVKKKDTKKEILSRVKNQYVEWHKESNNIDYKKFLSWFSHEWDDLEILLLKDGQIDEGKYGKLLGIFQGKGILQPGEIIKTKIIGMAAHKGTPTKKSFYLTIANWLRDDMEKKK